MMDMDDLRLKEKKQQENDSVSSSVSDSGSISDSESLSNSASISNSESISDSGSISDLESFSDSSLDSDSDSVVSVPQDDKWRIYHEWFKRSRPKAIQESHSDADTDSGSVVSQENLESVGIDMDDLPLKTRFQLKLKANKKEEMSQENYETGGAIENPQLNPLLNSCVLSNVMNYLSLNDLKNCRHVNSVWNDAASFWLKKKSVVRFDSFDYISDGGSDATLPEQKFLQVLEGYREIPFYVNHMREFGCTNYKVNFYAIVGEPKHSPHLNSSITFNEVLQNFGHDMKYFEFYCPFVSDQYFRSLKYTLSYNFPQLVHLVLHINLKGKSEELWEHIPVIPLPTVKHLDLKIQDKVKFQFFSIVGGEITTESFRLLAQNLLQRVPNLQWLTVSSEEIPYPCPFIGGQFVDQIYDQLKTFPHLHSVSIKAASFPSVESFSKIPANLKRLEILLPMTFSGTDSIEIQNMLEKLAPNLEELNLIIPTIHKRYQAPEIEMPIFPKLKKLGIQHQRLNRYFSNILVGGKKKERLSISFQFLGGEIIYAYHFPMLQELRLGNEPFSSGSGRVWRMYSIFIPSLGTKQIVESVRVLNVPCLKLTTRNITKAEPYLLAVMVRLSRSFPKVQKKCFRIACLKARILYNYAVKINLT